MYRRRAQRGRQLQRWTRTESAIKCGARAYLTKESAPAQLVQALRKIAAGGAYITAEVAEQLAPGAMPVEPATAPHASLSDREFEVFPPDRGGYFRDEIAARLRFRSRR